MPILWQIAQKMPAWGEEIAIITPGIPEENDERQAPAHGLPGGAGDGGRRVQHRERDDEAHGPGKTTLTVGTVPVKSLVSSADATTGRNNGTYAIAAGNSVSYVQDEVAGRSDLEVVAEGSLMQPGNQVLYTLLGSPIKSVADLTGRRIGVNALNNIGTLLITSVLREYELSASDVHFVAMNFPQMREALEHHQIDAAWLPGPFGGADGEALGLAELADLDQGDTACFPVGWRHAEKPIPGQVDARGSVTGDTVTAGKH